MIHPTAIISPNAKIGKNVSIGPYSIIGDQVEIGEDCWIGPHVVINGPCILGKQNKVFQFASIGEAPQDKKFAGENTRLVVGDRNVFRECCTIHRGTIQDNGVTQIGDDNLFMAYVHVAHDCVVGNHTILANNATLAGHVTVGDYAILGGFTGVHQFCKVGAHCFAGVGSVVVKDILPYVTVAGQNAVVHGLNSEGLKRRGFTPEQLANIKQAYKIIFRQGLTIEKALVALNEISASADEIQVLIDFIHQSTRGIVR